MSIAGKIKNCDNCGFQSSIFRFLKPEDKTLIEKNRYELVFQPGETIFKQGAACTHVASFSRGLAKMYIEGSGGKNLIIRFVRAQEFLAGIGVFYDDKHHYSVGAIDRSYLCFIEK